MMVVVLTFPSSTLEASRQRNLVLNLPPLHCKRQKQNKILHKTITYFIFIFFHKKIGGLERNEMRRLSQYPFIT